MQINIRDVYDVCIFILIIIIVVTLKMEGVISSVSTWGIDKNAYIQDFKRIYRRSTLTVIRSSCSNLFSLNTCVHWTFTWDHFSPRMRFLFPCNFTIVKLFLPFHENLLENLFFLLSQKLFKLLISYLNLFKW